MVLESSRKNIYIAMALVIIAGIALALGSFLYFQSHNTAPPVHASHGSGHLSSAKHVIKGFQYQASRGTQTTLTVKADQFVIQKKKFGFLSFGLMNEASFKNAVVRFFQQNGPSSTLLSEAGADLKQSKYISVDALDKGFLPFIGKKNITAVMFSPVLVEFYDGDKRMICVSADSASFKPKDKKMVFAGNVRVRSNEKELTTGRLSFDPKTERLGTRDAYRLEWADQTVTGKGIITDMALDSVSGSV